MKKFRYVILLLVMACMSFAFACKDSSSQITLSGFTLPAAEEEITVDAGSPIWIDDYVEDMHVVDQNGKEYNVVYDVTTKSGGYVKSSNGVFFAKEKEGYVVTYKVLTADKKVYTLTQKVNVIGDINLYAEYSTQLYSVGDTVTITPVYDYDNATISYVVKERATAADVTVTNGTFVPQNVGWYDITINATAPGANNDTFAYSIYARAAFTEGEVEVFGEDWSIIRDLDHYETNPGWSITSSEESGLLNHKGEEDTFLKTSVVAASKSAVYFWLNPRADRQYYVDLLEQGYEKITVWAYIESDLENCDSNHFVSRYLGASKPNDTQRGKEDLTNTSLTVGKDGGRKFVEGYWTEFSIRLADATGYMDYKYSFLSSYDYYKYEWTPMLEIETYTSSASAESHGTTTVYIGDIYATKDVDIALKADAQLDINPNDTVDFANYIDFEKLPANIELSYSLKKNGGEYEVLDGSSYTFTEYGQYELLVSSAQSNYKGSLTVNFTSPKTLDKGTYLLDINGKTSFDAKDMLNVAEKAVIDALPSELTYKVTGNGANVYQEGSEIPIAGFAEGIYSFSAEFMGISIWEAELDLYDSAKGAVWNEITAENGKLVGHYTGAYEESGTLSVVDSSTDAQLTGKTGNYYRFDNSARSYKWGIKVLPLHSKAYYETIVGSGEKFVQFDFKYVKTGESPTNDKWPIKRGYNLFNDGDNGNGSSDPNNYLNHIGWNYEPNTWYTLKLSLDYLLANKWDNALNATSGGSWLAGHFSFGGDTYEDAFSVYLGNVQVVATTEWRSEYYLWNGSQYVLDETATETGTGTSGKVITLNQKEILVDGVIYNLVTPDASYGENVLSGVLTAGETLVLKAYYNPTLVKTELGLRKDATLNLKEIFNESYSGDYTAITINALNAAGDKFDKTSAYSALITDGVMDTSSLDGMFEIDLEGNNGAARITFEQYKEGVFTWNNLGTTDSITVTKYTGEALDTGKTYTLETIAASALPEEGNSEKPAYVPGNDYYKFVIEDVASFNSGFGFKIMPVHSKAYYEKLMAEGKDISIITDYFYTKGGATPAVFSNWQVGYGLGYSTSSPNRNTDYAARPDSWVGKNAAGDESRHGMSLTTLLENWDNLVGDKGTMIGYRYGVDETCTKATETYTGEFTVYFGNVHIVSTDMEYSVKYFVKDADAADYVEVAELSETATAKLGATVTVDPKGSVVVGEGSEAKTYAYTSNNSNNVTSAIVSGNGTTVLKLYYAEAEARIIDGIIYDDTLDLAAELGEDVSSYTVTQYIVSSNGNIGVDVTAAYSGKVDGEGVLDLTSFDGIYTITAYGANDAINAVTFERAVKGTFTWNNVNNVNSVALTSAYGDAISHKLDVATVATTDLPAEAREGAAAYVPGSNYFKVSGSNFKSIFASDAIGVKILPVHSKEYYEAFYADGKDVTLQLDYLLDKNGDTSNDNRYSYLVGYDLGYDNNNSDDNDNPRNIDYYGLPNSWVGNGTTGDGSRHFIELSRLLANWTNLINDAKAGGGSMLGLYRATDTSANMVTETYEGEWALYFGNFHIVSEMEYSVEIYLEGEDGVFVKDEAISTVSTAKLGETVTVTPAKTITVGEGDAAVTYAYISANANNVTTDVITGNGTTAFKAYYSPVKSETISALRTDATLDFGAEDVGEVQEYVVMQYVVNTTEVTVDATTSAESATAFAKLPVDVTDDYKNLFTGSVADTSKLDGIFTITVIGTNGAKAITFEQYKEGVFTWNNINEVGHEEIVGAQLVGKYSKTKYTGTGVLTMENVDGVNYYKVAQADTTGSDAKFPYIRVFPVHSAEYYAMWYGATLTYSYKAEYVVEEGSANTAEDKLPLARVAYLGVVSKGEGSFDYAKSGTLKTYSFTFNELQFVRLSHTTTSTSYGSFIGLRTWAKTDDSALVATPFNLYVGNFTATKA